MEQILMDAVYVPLSTDLLVRLVERYEDGFPSVIEHVVEDFLERTEDDFFPSPRNTYDSGYAWDQVFLPVGTELRTRYKGEWKAARLENGKFHYEGKVYDSPAQVCNAMRGNTSNNAWRTLEIKRPQDVNFQLADRLRRR